MQSSLDPTILLPLISIAAYLLLMGAYAAALLTRKPTRRPPAAITVSVLKPLAGHDDELLENLESFAALGGLRYEVLFGVASPADPAAAAAREVLRRHPELDARLVVTDPDAALNPKVAQLVSLEREATGEVLVISDSNVRVPPTYLEELVGGLCAPRVGLVSSVIAGTGEKSIGAMLENLLIATHVTPGVVAGYALSGRAITIGKSMAMRRADLSRLGGFSRVADVLAEDHALARIFAAAGLKVALSGAVMENRNVSCSVQRSFERHARWAKIRRAMAPAGFALEPMLLPVVVATAAVLVSPSRAGLGLVVAAATVQVAGAWLSLRLLRGRALPWYAAPLEIARSFLLFGCWLGAWASRRVCWRGHALRVGPGTALERVRPGLLSRARAMWRTREA